MGEIRKQDKHIEILSKIPSAKLLAGITSTMTIEDFNVLCAKVEKKLNVKTPKSLQL